MATPTIAPLACDSLADALRLSTTAGWNQRLDDWRMLLQIAPRGAFAAVADGRIIGTAIGIDYGRFAWIAMMLVDPPYRRSGLGARLLEAAMSAVPGNLPIRLDATPMGRPLYQKYGFEDESTLSRCVSDASSRRSAVEPPHEGARVRPCTPSDMERIVEQDPGVFGGTRAAVLEWEFRTARPYACVIDGPDGLIQYCLGREGRLFDQVGPVVASDADAAHALVRAAASAAGDRPVAVDAFDSHPAFATALRLLGFSTQRPLFRMCRPAASPCITRSPASALSEFAIVGPEFA